MEAGKLLGLEIQVANLGHLLVVQFERCFATSTTQSSKKQTNRTLNPKHSKTSVKQPSLNICYSQPGKGFSGGRFHLYYNLNSLKGINRVSGLESKLLKGSCIVVYIGEYSEGTKGDKEFRL